MSCLTVNCWSCRWWPPARQREVTWKFHSGSVCFPSPRHRGLYRWHVPARWEERRGPMRASCTEQSLGSLTMMMITRWWLYLLKAHPWTSLNTESESRPDCCSCWLNTSFTHLINIQVNKNSRSDHMIGCWHALLKNWDHDSLCQL